MVRTAVIPTAMYPLINASLGGYPEVVDLPLDRGTDVRHQNKFGCIVLNATAQEGHLPIVNKLPERGADLNTVDVDQWKAQIFEAERGHTEIMQRLRQ